MSNERNGYDRSFKIHAVSLSYERENIKELADELGIPPTLLYRWRRKFRPNEGSSSPDQEKQREDNRQTEIARLKREIAEVRMERDILKKAANIFSRSDGTSTLS